MKSVRQQILEFDVPESLLRRYTQDCRAKEASKLQEEIERRGRFWQQAADESHVWRKKYLLSDRVRLEHEHLNALKDERIAELEAATEKHLACIADLRKQIFAETSERRKTQNENLPNPAPANVEQATKSGKKKGKQAGAPGCGRRTEDQTIKRIPVVHDLPFNCCQTCQLPFEECPAVVSEEVDLIEGIVIRQHIRKKARRNRACKCPETPRFSIAEAPPKLISGGKYSTNFWRFVIEEKFCLQRPVNRIISKLKFNNLKKISAGTISNGLMIIHESLIFELIYLSIIDRNRAAGQWNMDETGWKVFCESDQKRSPKWYMWVSVASDTCVFMLDPRRSNEVIVKHLKGVSQGIICSDRHSAYKAFGNRNDGFLIAFCWIHQRRDFIKMQTGFLSLVDWCQSWLDRIDALLHQNKVRVSYLDDPAKFEIQDEILRLMLTQMESDIRQQLKAKKKLHEEQVARLVSLQEHWTGLTVFLEHPLVPTDNNAAERALRNLVVGRKNYYGSRAVWSGEFNAQLATIYATLELNNADPRQWMDDYMQACALNQGNPPPDLQPFLPWNYKSKNHILPNETVPTNPETEPITISILPNSEPILEVGLIR